MFDLRGIDRVLVVCVCQVSNGSTHISSPPCFCWACMLPTLHQILPQKVTGRMACL